MIRCFPEPYNDELLASVCARYAARMQYVSVQAMKVELFGCQISTPMVDLPRCLDHLSQQMPADSGWTVDRFINESTLFPYYEAFLPHERASQYRMSTRTSYRPSPWIWSLPGVPLERYLRLCAECVKTDVSAYGEPYWHRVHQISGIQVCPVHRTVLIQTRVGRYGPYRFVTAAQAIEPLDLSQPRTVPANAVAVGLAEDAQYLLGGLGPHEYKYWSECYTSVLIHQGLAGHAGRILVSDVRHMVRQFLKTSDTALYLSRKQAWFLAQRISSVALRKAITHPMLHLLFIRSLGYTFQSFLREVQPYRPFGLPPWPCLNRAAPHYRRSVITVCKVRTHALNRKVRGEFGCRCGFVYVRIGPYTLPDDRFVRPEIVKIYGPVWEGALKGLARDGLSFKAMGKRLGIGGAAIKRHLALLNNPSPRKRPRRIVEKAVYRKRWLSLLRQHSTANRATLYKAGGHNSRWLLKYDRDWLRIHLPPLQRPNINGSLKAVWAGGDKALAKAVLSCAQELRRSKGRPTTIHRKRIAQRLGLPPESLTGNLPAFPLTRRALERVTDLTRDRGILRRLRWVRGQLVGQPRRVSMVSIARLAGISYGTLRKRPYLKPLIHECIALGMGNQMAA